MVDDIEIDAGTIVALLLGAGAAAGTLLLWNRMNELVESPEALPGSQRQTVRLDAADGDLGDQIAPLLERFKTLRILLEQDQVYTWNTPITLDDYQHLTISKVGPGGNAQRGRVDDIWSRQDWSNFFPVIRMTEHRTWVWDGEEHRDINRVTVNGDGARFTLFNTVLVEEANDDRPLARPGNRRGLFVIRNGNGFMRTGTTFFQTGEDLFSFGPVSNGYIMLGAHNWVKGTRSDRDIFVAKEDDGWNAGGNGGVVGRHNLNMRDARIEDHPAIEVRRK